MENENARAIVEIQFEGNTAARTMVRKLVKADATQAEISIAVKKLTREAKAEAVVLLSGHWGQI